MLILITFAFLAGIVTILSPCILPVLPIILSSTVDSSGKQRPFGVVIGFILSFTFFTLFLSSLAQVSGISGDVFRYISIFVLAGFGLSMLIPQVQQKMEILFSKLSGLAPNMTTKHGFFGGLVIGLSLGLLWTPCVGPILASVISLALTGSVTTQTFFITLAYSIGTAIPMFIIMIVGSTALQKVPWLLRNTSKIQKIFGILMILTAIAIYFNFDRQFQSYILEKFPSYGTGLTKIEDNSAVKTQLYIAGQPTNNNAVRYDSKLPKGPEAPEIIPGGEWFNSDPLTLEELKGKVVIVDFWTYSCINCIRTLPYIEKWWETYKDDGLVIIGVHSPEFEFEKNPKNVEKAIQDFGLTYPIVQDNNFSTWRNYSNQYWPAKYIIDKDGFIRYYHFGEGEYDQTEEVIQKLLKETGAENVDKEINNADYDIESNTPETYLGYARLSGFASNENIVRDKTATYSAPKNLPSNSVAYEGDWNVMDEYANPQKGAKLYLNFDAKDVYLVMRTKGDPSKVKVYVDDKLQYFGEDNIEGTVTITKDSLYRLIKLPTAGRHILRLEFEDENTEVYAFTFG